MATVGAGPGTRTALGGDVGDQLPPALLSEAICLRSTVCVCIYDTGKDVFLVVRRLYNVQSVPEHEVGSLKHLDPSYPQ